MVKSNLKKYGFKLKTLFINDNYNVCVKRVPYKNSLYIYLYEKGLFRFRKILGLKVIVNE